VPVGLLAGAKSEKDANTRASLETVVEVALAGTESGHLSPVHFPAIKKAAPPNPDAAMMREMIAAISGEPRPPGGPLHTGAYPSLMPLISAMS